MGGTKRERDYLVTPFQPLWELTKYLQPLTQSLCPSPMLNKYLLSELKKLVVLKGPKLRSIVGYDFLIILPISKPQKRGEALPVGQFAFTVTWLDNIIRNSGRSRGASESCVSPQKAS